MIRQSESIDKLSAAIIAARAEMPSVGKSGFNNFDKYTYAKLENYVAAVEDHLIKYQLMVITGSGKAEQLPERKNSKGGSEYVVRVSLAMRLLHSSGQWIEVEAVGEGQDRSDKGIYKAHTGARKYGYASLFGLATTDDQENHEDDKPPPKSQRDTPQAPPKENVRTVLGRVVAEWAGVGKDDVPAACRDFIGRSGLDPKTITDAEVERLTAQAKDFVTKGIRFPGPDTKPAGSAPTKRTASISG